MKATELMVYDWVYLTKDYGTLKKEILKIDILDLDRVFEGMLEIESIPLTPEILKNNGFGIDDSFRPHHFWRSADNRVILYNDDEYLNTFNKWHVHVDTEDMRTIGSIEQTYVHQLQQFLRLCGMNGMANNFKV